MATEDFRRIFETLRVPVVGADAAGLVAFANAAFVELAARGKALAGQEIALLFEAADRKRVLQNVARVAEGKAATAFLDAQLLRPDGSTRWVSLALQPWLDSRERPSGAIAVVQDIGAQRETEAALNLSAARLLALAEVSPAAKMVETAAGEIEIANHAFCRLLGLDAAPESLTGVRVDEALARSAHPDPRALLERHPVIVDGLAQGFVWTSSDPAVERRPDKAAAEVALIERIALELSVALEGLAALSIRAQQSEMDPLVVENLQRIRQATETAVAAIGDIVDFSRLSGAVVLQRRQFGLRAALADLVARVSATVEERGGRLRLKVEQDVADSLVGDVERLQLVLKNLVETAFSISPAAEVTLQITPEYVTGAGIQLSFSVFASGGPAGPAPPRVSPEAGMGVAVAKFMVAAMGGNLAISSRAGPDALYAFTIEFPQGPPSAAPPRATHATLVGLPVLLVSSDSAQRNQVASVLRGWRMVPLEADNAPMALTLLDRLHQEGTPVPLVILSNRLPVQDGFLLAFRIRNHPRFASTIVMMLATEGRPGDAIACRENGIAAYMRYPISDRQLREAIMAVTGASADVAETVTLVTRHSLRETRKGANVLLVDANRDAQIQAAHILGREEASVVVARDLAEALAALEKDIYDLVIVDTALEGLAGADAFGALKGRMGREAAQTMFAAVSASPTPEFRQARMAEGFHATLAKPFRREELAQLLSRIPAAAEAARQPG